MGTAVCIVSPFFRRLLRGYSIVFNFVRFARTAYSEREKSCAERDTPRKHETAASGLATDRRRFDVRFGFSIFHFSFLFLIKNFAAGFSFARGIYCIILYTRDYRISRSLSLAGAALNCDSAGSKRGGKKDIEPENEKKKKLYHLVAAYVPEVHLSGETYFIPM